MKLSGVTKEMSLKYHNVFILHSAKTCFVLGLFIYKDIIIFIFRNLGSIDNLV